MEYYGVKDVHVIWINEWVLPMIQYKDKRFNLSKLEEPMLSHFNKAGYTDPEDFPGYVNTHPDDVINICEQIITKMNA